MFKDNAERNVSIENAGWNNNGRDDYLLKIDASEENAGWDAANADRIAYEVTTIFIKPRPGLKMATSYPIQRVLA